MMTPVKSAILEAKAELAMLEEIYAPLTTDVVIAAAPDDPRLEVIDSVHMIEWEFRAEQLAALTVRESVEMPGFAYGRFSAQPLTTATEPEYALAA